MMLMLGVSPVKAYAALFRGAFGSKNGIAEIFVKATPLILTGLSYAYAARAGLINIGAEGQLYMGGIFATLVGTQNWGYPMALHIFLAVAAGFLGGALWGLLAGWLKVAFQANEIITTVMLNYIAILLVSFCVTGPMKNPAGNMPESSPIQDSATLFRILPGTRLHLGFLISIGALIFYYFLIWRMKQGFEIRVVGHNQEAARSAGMRPERTLLLTMFLAGGMGGLAGAVEILGIQGRLLQLFSPGYGFDGIAVSLVGMNHPVGIGLGAILFGILRAGGNKMQLIAKVPVSVIYILQGLVIVSVIVSSNLKGIISSRKSKQKEATI
jgi:simple sugar transport system permease protein